MFFVTFSCGILGQVWYLIVSIPDCCHLSYPNSALAGCVSSSWYHGLSLQSMIVAFPGHTHFLNSLILCIRENPYTSAFAYSEDPDEMQHDAAFHQVLRCL